MIMKKHNILKGQNIASNIMNGDIMNGDIMNGDIMNGNIMKANIMGAPKQIHTRTSQLNQPRGQLNENLYLPFFMD